MRLAALRHTRRPVTERRAINWRVLAVLVFVVAVWVAVGVWLCR